MGLGTPLAGRSWPVPGFRLALSWPNGKPDTPQGTPRQPVVLEREPAAGDNRRDHGQKKKAALQRAIHTAIY